LQEIDAVLERMNINVAPETAEDQLLDGAGSIERCSQCEWWTESAVLEVASDGKILCEQCWPDFE
jgi:hypothetical protein